MAMLFEKLINLSHLSIFSKVSGASLQRCGGWRLHSTFACAYTLNKKLKFYTFTHHTHRPTPPRPPTPTTIPYHTALHCNKPHHTPIPHPNGPAHVPELAALVTFMPMPTQFKPLLMSPYNAMLSRFSSPKLLPKWWSPTVAFDEIHTFGRAVCTYRNILMISCQSSESATSLF